MASSSARRAFRCLTVRPLGFVSAVALLFLLRSRLPDSSVSLSGLFFCLFSLIFFSRFNGEDSLSLPLSLKGDGCLVDLVAGEDVAFLIVDFGEEDLDEVAGLSLLALDLGDAFEGLLELDFVLAATFFITVILSACLVSSEMGFKDLALPVAEVPFERDVFFAFSEEAAEAGGCLTGLLAAFFEGEDGTAFLAGDDRLDEDALFFFGLSSSVGKRRVTSSAPTVLNSVHLKPGGLFFPACNFTVSGLSSWGDPEPWAELPRDKTNCLGGEPTRPSAGGGPSALALTLAGEALFDAVFAFLGEGSVDDEANLIGFALEPDLLPAGVEWALLLGEVVLASAVLPETFSLDFPTGDFL